MENPRYTSPYRWVIIFLCLFTASFTIAIPTMSLSVLFAEIAADINLDIVQIGLIWSVSSLTGMFMGFAGGILGDRFGGNKLLIIACLGIGVIGASRGLAIDFASFMVTSFLLGLFTPLVGINLHTVAGQWFAKRQLGLANGIISAGFAGGFMLGSLLAANTLSPLVGGWRNLLFVYGGLSLLLALAWYLLHPKREATSDKDHIPLRQGLPQVLRSRTVWLVGFGKLGFWACIRGFTGYLPTYLRNVGWEPQSADSALSSFFLVSLLGSVLIPFISDRMGIRRPFLVVAALLTGVGVLATGFLEGSLIFVAAMLAGLMFDALMGLTVTAIIEIKEIEDALIGTALGVMFFLSEIGGTIGPALGNMLADISAELPFYLWGGMSLLAIFAFAAIREE